MEIQGSGSQPSNKASAEWFTGSVRIDPLFEAPEPARVRGASVTFEPGARTAWHTHPLGQTLIVTSGLGWVQCWGGAIGRLSRLLHGPVPRTSRQLPAWRETPASVGACHFH
jgi:quercetin dioxygenase-like cupin family protein